MSGDGEIGCGSASGLCEFCLEVVQVAPCSMPTSVTGIFVQRTDVGRECSGLK
jgi:hypothetical protein